MGKYDKFKNLNYNKFIELASDDSLSCFEKIGFPVEYRKGKEGKIFKDIKCKLPNLLLENKLVLDIGPGCSELPLMLIELCRVRNHQLILVDSYEMLSMLPDEDFILKVPGRYPADCDRIFEKYSNSIDVVLTYSVIQYIFAEANIFEFIDKSLKLMADNGEMLVGDIPNISKRKRFFSSNNGIVFHQNFTSSKEIPDVRFNNIEYDQIDDSVVMAIIQRCRNSGFDSYIVPQGNGLPMANRREDILIRKP